MTEEEQRVETLADTYNVTLTNFEGPLDLLLHLCQKHELDILDIPISFVTQKYLEYLAVMKLMNLDVAAEYLVMAATLAHIKSKMLLPAPPPGQEDDLSEEEQDPRGALIKRLLEYQKYKHAAADLVSRGITGADIFYRGTKIEEAVDTGPAPLAPVPLFSLVEAFQSVLAKAKVQVTHDIVADRISLTDRMQELTLVLQRRRRIVFEELFEGLTTRFDLVITFLALLEMCRDRIVRLYQTEPLAPLYLESTLLGDDTDPTEADEALPPGGIPATLRTGETPPPRVEAPYPAPELLEEEPLPSLFDEGFAAVPDDSRSSMIIEAAATVVDHGFGDDVFPGEPSTEDPFAPEPGTSSDDVFTPDRDSLVLETAVFPFQEDVPDLVEDAASGEMARVSMVRDVDGSAEDSPLPEGAASGEIAVASDLSGGQSPAWGRDTSDPPEGNPDTTGSGKTPMASPVGETDTSGTGLAKTALEVEPDSAVDPPEETA